MEIRVNKHAIKEFKLKTFNNNWDDEQIKRRLESVARQGSIIHRRPGNTFEIAFENLYIVANKENDMIVVITFLGNEQYRKWAKRQVVHPRYNKRYA